MNIKTIEKLKHIRLKSAVLAALLAGSTWAAAVPTEADSYMDGHPLMSNSDSFGDESVVEETVLPVTINNPGSLYVSRVAGMINFWTLDANTMTFNFETVAKFSGESENEVLLIQLNPEINAIFYADNLVDPNSSNKFQFTGELSDGKIAIPLAASHFQPLVDELKQVGESVLITVDTPDLNAMYETQMAVFHEVELSSLQRNDDINHFVDLASKAVLEYQVLAETYADRGIALLTAYEEQTLFNKERFLNQVNRDLEQLNISRNDLTETINSHIQNSLEGTLSCMERHSASLDEVITRLASNLGADQADENHDPNTETLIDDAATQADTLITQLEKCEDNLAPIDHFDPDDFINEIAYQKLIEDLVSLESTIEAEVEQFEINLMADAHDLVKGMDTDDLIARAINYEHSFATWISPQYMAISTTLSQSKDTKQPMTSLPHNHESVAADEHTAKVAEMLCENETFNISFAVLGIQVVLGTPWNDQVKTGATHDFIMTFSGDDCIESHAGYDVVLSGSGKDKIFSGDDHDLVYGGKGEDEIHGSAGKDYTFSIGPVPLTVNIGNLLIGGPDNDKIYGGEVHSDKGDDGVIDPYGYTDVILGDTSVFGGSPGKDLIDGEMGIDFLFGQSNDDVIKNVVPGAITIAGVPNLFGSFFFGNQGDDVITGSNTPSLVSVLGDFLFGNDGNDTIKAGGGLDFSFGGRGNDNISGEKGPDFVFGNHDQDHIDGGDGMDLVAGGVGNDIVRGSAGLFDLLLGGLGHDTMFGGQGIDMILGGKEADTINGDQNFDLVFGGDGDDFIRGNDFTDLLLGNRGMDIIHGDDGIDGVFGNQDTDTLYGGQQTDVMLGGPNTVGSDSIEKMFGGTATDLMFGNSGREKMYGEAGHDFMAGNSDNDQVFGGDEMDIMLGNADDDIMAGQRGMDFIFGGTGDDHISGGDNSDLGVGNQGCDTINGDAAIDVLLGDEDNDIITGGAGSDLLVGSSGNDTLTGNSGNDVLIGSEGNDYLDGGSSVDGMIGGSGHDHMYGGGDTDYLVGNHGNDYMKGDTGNDWLFGGANNDVIDGANGNDKMFAQTGDDKVNSGFDTDWSFGGRGADRMRAVEGTNFVFGNRGNDTLDGYWSAGGSDPRDRMWGNRDNDTITGNKTNQRDRRYGGLGSDTKHWNTTKVSSNEFVVNWTAPGCNR